MPDEAVVVAEELDGKRLLFSLLFSFLDVTIKMNLTQKKHKLNQQQQGRKSCQIGSTPPKASCALGWGKESWRLGC